eukprot:287617_1
MKLNLLATALFFSKAGNRGVVSAEKTSGIMPPRDLHYDDYHLVYVGEYDTNPTDFPLSLCEGDCDNDSECEDYLHCFKREPTSTDYVPYCLTGETDNPGKDYCTIRDVVNYPWLLKIGDNGVREDNHNDMEYDPLGLCEGDCDKDDHCEYGLKCFKRSGTTPVPYPCVNVGGDPGEDYCICDPNIMYGYEHQDCHY